MNYAPFWKRACALLVDVILVTTVLFTVWVVFWLILTVLTYLLSVSLNSLIGADASRHALLFVLKIIWTIVAIVLPIGLYGYYFARMESSVMQGGVGKLCMGIRVCDLEGNRITLKKAWWRYFNKLVSALTIVGMLIPLWTVRKQALHDKMSGTVVVTK